LRVSTTSRRSACQSSSAISQPGKPGASSPARREQGLVGLHPCTLGAPHRIETGHAPSSETYRFARSWPLGSARRPDSAVGLLSWGSSRPLRQHDRLCVHSHLDRRPDFGPGLPRPGLVPFLPFLPAPTVSSAEARPESRTLDSVRVCCTPQPALGFALFPAPLHLAVARPEGRFGSLSQKRRPFEAFPPPAA
jgi:hypothetical protein